jgi:hypothetical protein
MTSRWESDLAIYLNKYQERKIVQLFLEYFIQVEQEKARENQIDLMSEKLLSVKVQKICESDNAPEGWWYEKAIRRRLKENGGVNTREIEADIEMKLQNWWINTF